MHVVTDADRLKVKEYFKQALDVMRRIEEHQAEMKDILNVLKEEHEIKPSIARKVMKAMDKGNMPEIKMQNETLEDLYDIVSSSYIRQSAPVAEAAQEAMNEASMEAQAPEGYAHDTDDGHSESYS